MQQVSNLENTPDAADRSLSAVRRRSALDRYAGLLWGGGTIIALLTLWEVGAQLGWLNRLFFSRPSAIAQQWVRMVENGTLIEATLTSLYALVVGFVLAALLGVTVGLLAGWYRRFEYVVDPFVWLLYNAPKVAFYPLLIIWIGLGTPTVIALTVLFAVFPIYANTFSGVRDVDPLYITAAQSFGANSRQLFVSVALPASMPFIAAGLRLGLGRAMLGVIIGEVFGSPDGLGALLNHEASMLRTDRYFAALTMVVLVGLLITQVLRLFERRLDRWRDSQQAL